MTIEKITTCNFCKEGIDYSKKTIGESFNIDYTDLEMPIIIPAEDIEDAEFHICNACFRMFDIYFSKGRDKRLDLWYWKRYLKMIKKGKK